MVTATVAVVFFMGLAPAASASPETLAQYLGQAGPSSQGSPWGVLAFTSISCNGPSTVNGNVGVGNGGTYNLASPCTFDDPGSFYEGSGVSGSNSGVISGSDTVSDTSLMTDAQDDADSANTTFQGLTPTQTLPAVQNSGNTTYIITGTDGQNVISIPSVTFSQGTLEIQGPADATFIIVVPGNFSFGHSTMTLSGGVSAANVLFDVEGTLSITGGGSGTLYGYLMDLDAANNAVQVHDYTLNGELITDSVQLTSGFTINSPAQVLPQLPQFPYAMPAAIAAAAILGSALVLARRRGTRLA